MYNMPVAMFIGSNHHLQNVVFGQALLQDEQADTFNIGTRVRIGSPSNGLQMATRTWMCVL